MLGAALAHYRPHGVRVKLGSLHLLVHPIEDKPRALIAEVRALPGQIVELGDVFTIFDHPLHPYTKLLMKALPVITKKEGRLETIPGTVPDLSKPIQGCRFADRCPDACDRCHQVSPAMTQVTPGHLCACHLVKGGEAHV